MLLMAVAGRESPQLCRDAAKVGASYALVIIRRVGSGLMTKEMIIRFHINVNAGGYIGLEESHP